MAKPAWLVAFAFVAVGCSPPPLPPPADGGSNGAPDLLRAAPTCIAAMPSPVDFGGARVGYASQPLNMTVDNVCVQALRISGVALAGANRADFAIDLGVWANKLPLEMAGGTSITYAITFTPSGAGVRTVEIDIASDDPTAPLVAVAGSGMAQ